MPAVARSDAQGSPREALRERARPALPHTASKALAASRGELTGLFGRARGKKNVCPALSTDFSSFVVVS